MQHEMTLLWKRKCHQSINVPLFSGQPFYFVVEFLHTLCDIFLDSLFCLVLALLISCCFFFFFSFLNDLALCDTDHRPVFLMDLRGKEPLTGH